MNEEIINNYKNNRCSCCQECCNDILYLSKREIKNIQKYLEEIEIEPAIYAHIDNGKPTMDLRCPFRNVEKKICSIYEARPQICRIFRCDRPRKEAIEIRDRTNLGKNPYSLREIFFNDDRNIIFLEEYFHFYVERYHK